MAIKVQGETVVYDDKSVQISAGTSGERPSAPSQGRLYYNNELGNFEVYDGGSWTPLAKSDHQHSISDITDITSSNISNWNISYNRSVTGVSGSGNGTLTISRQGSNITANLSHSHSSSDLPNSIVYENDSPTFDDVYVNNLSGGTWLASGLNISNWDTAYNRSFETTVSTGNPSGGGSDGDVWLKV